MNENDECFCVVFCVLSDEILAECIRQEMVEILTFFIFLNFQAK
jgi:hypothetical protein